LQESTRLWLAGPWRNRGDKKHFPRASGAFTVPLSKEEFQALQPKVGEPVVVALRNVKVFSDDYSI